MDAAKAAQQEIYSMNLFELTELSNEDFCKEIVQIDSEVLIDLLKTEEYTILKDKCLEMIK